MFASSSTNRLHRNRFHSGEEQESVQNLQMPSPVLPDKNHLVRRQRQHFRMRNTCVRSGDLLRRHPGGGCFTRILVLRWVAIETTYQTRRFVQDFAR